MLRKWFFDLQYRFSRPPWDSGITPPELTALIEGGQVVRGRALDLGCGTGTNSIYLARHGFTVVGVDFAEKAIMLAREKAKRAGVAIAFYVADVSRLDFLTEPFDLVFDIGCFHSVDASARPGYAQNLARLTHPGSLFLLYAFSPRPPGERGHLFRWRNVGVTPEQVQRTFAQHLALRRVEHGADRGDRASAWYWFDRK